LRHGLGRAGQTGWRVKDHRSIVSLASQKDKTTTDVIATTYLINANHIPPAGI